MAGRTVSVIGVKQILYGEPLEAAPTYATLESLFTSFKEVPNVHQGHMSLPKRTVQQQSIRTN